MNGRKYDFTGKTKVNDDGVILHQIIAIRDFGEVKKYTIGGWIEKEENLSHEGSCWVYDDAEVYGSARVYEDARVEGDARMYGNAEVHGNARIGGDAQVYGYAEVYGYARVYGSAWVYRSAKVYGNANVFGDVILSGDSEVLGSVSVSGNERYAKENNLWFLREGDFRPEQVKNFNGGRGIETKNDLKLLKEAGNLFLTKEEASIASEKVREFICSINNPWCL